ncbi:hypothetical protein [Vibrio barjaei]|uniref:hypothetical protein n=1 Tax=Vibrio barjaei TaxID=1676683 RepID=UPI002283C2BE|nr:hypothetical protein [Vibrio barjaei]MCY9874522.1 hypothetical protein [Vibrio barjaei]
MTVLFKVVGVFDDFEIEDAEGDLGSLLGKSTVMELVGELLGYDRESAAYQVQMNALWGVVRFGANVIKAPRCQIAKGEAKQSPGEYLVGLECPVHVEQTLMSTLHASINARTYPFIENDDASFPFQVSRTLNDSLGSGLIYTDAKKHDALMILTKEPIIKGIDRHSVRRVYVYRETKTCEIPQTERERAF